MSFFPYKVVGLTQGWRQEWTASAVGSGRNAGLGVVTIQMATCETVLTWKNMHMLKLTRFASPSCHSWALQHCSASARLQGMPLGDRRQPAAGGWRRCGRQPVPPTAG